MFHTKGHTSKRLLLFMTENTTDYEHFISLIILVLIRNIEISTQGVKVFVLP